MSLSVPPKNLLFDLGGVIYGIDIERMFAAIRPMLKPGHEMVKFTKDNQHEVFYQMDKGEIPAEEFATILKEAHHLEGTTEQILEAWNALLVGVLPGREEGFAALAPHYNMALLSNTNFFHRKVFEPQCASIFQHLDRLFFSCDMGMRKPDAEIYLTTLGEMGWAPEETMFIDDTRSNIEAAAALGIQTFWMEKETDFAQLMEQLGQPMAI
ncbi:MAG: HAD family phosphatase [Bacteroidota bacterium]